jgi:lysophospholipase L1-like esterase
MMQYPRSSALAALALAAALTGPAGAQYWSRSWAAAVQASPAPESDRALPNLKDKTVRQIVRLSAGGHRFRLRLSNELTPADIRIGIVRVALIGVDGAMVAGSMREVRFSGRAGARMLANAPLLSDPLDLAVKPFARLAVSIHLPEDTQQLTFHAFAGAGGWIAPGDQTAAPALQDATAIASRILIAAVDVESARPRATIVAFGDSITDGAYATPDTNRRWPDLLAERLQGARIDKAVANVGIGGNRVLHHGAADNALARFDRDVLAVPGVSHVLVLEGINDIGGWKRDPATAPSAEALIDGFRQLIARAHASRVKLILCTIPPFEGAGGYTAEGEAVRRSVNAWIRTGGEADGVVDFDRAIADPASPGRMLPAYDSGDKLHPGDVGFAAMAWAIDLALFR